MDIGSPGNRFVLSRRSLLSLLGTAGGLALGAVACHAEAYQESSEVPPFTGPTANPNWNSVGPYVSEPQKAPLLLLTDRGVQPGPLRHDCAELNTAEHQRNAENCEDGWGVGSSQAPR
jgi:hypothetical protein